ncbi:MAG: ribulose-phosphate 3-epimerase [Candidatus Coatesbacteria bacterium]|nr:MAG: ribulose-phosphate 3-epimerase [Candidatus Coatesbacteria bacterium]
MAELAPSILSADFGRAAEAIALCRETGLRYVHLDVMDGRFVPEITFGSKMTADLRAAAGGMEMIAHLMVAEPERQVNSFCEAGADYVEVHVEATAHAHRAVQAARGAGKKGGIALNPQTPVAAVEPILGDIDILLLMSVNPGWGGQSFIEPVYAKIGNARRTIDDAGLSGKCLLEVDGGVKPENAARVAEAGADIVVAGSAVFGTADPRAAIEELKGLIQ